MALHADCECPCVLGKPTCLRCRIADVGSARRIAVAKHVKRITLRIAKSVFVRFDRKRRTGNHMIATLAANGFLRFEISAFVDFRALVEIYRKTLAHRASSLF